MAGGGRPHRFPYDNFSSVYRIFTRLGHMIPQWKGKNPIYFEVNRSKVMVTININRILTTGSFPHDNFSSVHWIFTKIGHVIPLWTGKNPIYFGVIISKVKVTVTMNIFLSTAQLAHYVFTTLQFGCCLVRSLSYVKITLPQRILDT